jgi:hypothetical protein
MISGMFFFETHDLRYVCSTIDVLPPDVRPILLFVSQTGGPVDRHAHLPLIKIMASLVARVAHHASARSASLLAQEATHGLDPDEQPRNPAVCRAVSRLPQAPHPGVWMRLARPSPPIHYPIHHSTSRNSTKSTASQVIQTFEALIFLKNRILSLAFAIFSSNAHLCIKKK